MLVAAVLLGSGCPSETAERVRRGDSGAEGAAADNAAAEAESTGAHGRARAVRDAVLERFAEDVDANAAKTAFDQAIAASDARRPELLIQIYASRGFEPWLVDGGGWTPAGEEALAALRDSRAHGLNPETFVRGVELKSPTHNAEAASDWWTDADSRSLAAALENSRWSGTPNRAVVDAVLRGDVALAGPPIDARKKAETERRTAALRARLTSELALADGLLSYVAVQKFSNIHHWPDEDVEQAGGREALIRDASSAWMLDVASGRVPLKSALSTVAPSHVQYGRLVETYRRYERLCSGEAWPKLTGRKTLKIGRKGEEVAALRRRLQLEGYESSAADGLDGVFDESLASAIMRYQETHQFKPNGKVDKKLRESLNRGCEYRLAEVAVTLQRWRETRIADPLGYFIHVNIPDFHGEVWDGGEVLRRFRVITGKRRHFTRRDGTRVYKYATPELSSVLKHIVFNPYWNVPKSIREREIEPEIEKDPEYLEKHNYEIVELNNGNTLLRQRPGPGNALGRVKFLFPNPYDVYLHDTPNKRLFRNPVRAYSHGCMRVQDPLELAGLLLEREGRSWRQYTRRAARQWVNLDQQIPVYVEYFVVRVDDAGQVHFNADVYRRDEDRVAAWLERYSMAAQGK